MTPTIGRVVHLRLSEGDAAVINQTREKAGIVGNRATEGAVYPAVIVAVFGRPVNLHVLLDGPDSYWATSRSEGDGPGFWSWPPRV